MLAARSSQLSAAASSSAAGVTCWLPASLLPHPAHNSAILPPAWLPTACGCLLLSPIALCAGKAAKEAGSSSPENQFIRGIIALHDKYMEYVQVGGWWGMCGGGRTGSRAWVQALDSVFVLASKSHCRLLPLPAPTAANFMS